MGALLLVKLTVNVFLVDSVAYFVNRGQPVRPLLRTRGWVHCPAVYTLLAILQVVISGVLIFLILLHSGKDAGLSGAFGIGGGGSSFGGGSMVERNLDRATVFFAVLFVVNTLVLLKI
jgi:preprotein translocase subunit SecG